MSETPATESIWRSAIDAAQDLVGHAGNEHFVLAGGILAGVMYCFLGYRLIRVLIALTGFVLAALPAVVVAAWLSQAHPVAMAVAGFIGGLAGAAFMTFVYRAGIFCLGFLGTALIAHHLLTATELSWAPWAVLGLGVAGGLLALLIERPVITVATAAVGAWVILISAALLLMKSDLAETTTAQELTSNASLTIVAAWTVLAVAGTLAQFATYRRPNPPVETS